MAILQKRLTWNRQANAVILTKRNRIQWCLYSCYLRLLCQKRNKLRLPNKRPSAITASFELQKLISARGAKLNRYGSFSDHNLSFQNVLKISLSFCLKDKSPKSFESKYKITTRLLVIQCAVLRISLEIRAVLQIISSSEQWTGS